MTLLKKYKRKDKILFFIIILELLIYTVCNSVLLCHMQTEEDSEYDLLASIVLLLFSPYFWVSTIFLFNKIFDKIRVNKNRKLNIETE